MNRLNQEMDSVGEIVLELLLQKVTYYKSREFYDQKLENMHDRILVSLSIEHSKNK
jgi:hypothetical protein